MAWISVHESLNGSKLRRLFKALGCSKFEATGILVFLWFWGLNNADSTGRIQYADVEDIRRELYGVGTGCNLSIDEVVDALFETGWIDRAEDGGLYLHDWNTWQAQWYKALDQRKINAKHQKDFRERRKNDDAGKPLEISQQSTEAKEGQNNSEDLPQISMTPPGDELKKPKESKAKKSAAPKSYGLAFEQFWEEYPRKDDKAYAYQKYMARLKDGWSEDELLRAAKNYAYVCKKKGTERDYIKQAKTFLSESTPFTDFLPKKPRIDPQVPNMENPFAEYKDE